MFYGYSQEAGIGQVPFKRCFCAAPEAVPLDVYADKIPSGMLFRQRNGIFPASAAQFKRDWIFIPEKNSVPLAFQFVIRRRIGDAGLDDIAECSNLGEAGKFLYELGRDDIF